MAVSPNGLCENFCIWMQATSWLKITAPQNVIIEEVKDAAAASGTVTEHVWNEFLRTTGLWYQYYTAYLQQTSQTAFLPSGIVQGDLLYGSAANVLSRLAKDSGTSRFLKNSGTSNNPAWARPSALDLSDYVPVTDYTPTLVGFTGGFTYKIHRYSVLNKELTLYFTIYGTGSGTTCSMTLPAGYSVLNLTGSYYGAIISQNNGANNLGASSIAGNGTVVNFFPTGAFGAWTTATPRLVGGFLRYMIN